MAVAFMPSLRTRVAGPVKLLVLRLILYLLAGDASKFELALSIKSGIFRLRVEATYYVLHADGERQLRLWRNIESPSGIYTAAMRRSRRFRPRNRPVVSRSTGSLPAPQIRRTNSALHALWRGGAGVMVDLFFIGAVGVIGPKTQNLRDLGTHHLPYAVGEIVSTRRRRRFA